MRAGALAVTATSLLLSTACGNITKELKLTVAAEPLKPVSALKAETNLGKVHELIQDSQQKCSDYVTTLFSRAAAGNTILDITTIILSSRNGIHPIIYSSCADCGSYGHYWRQDLDTKRISQ